jgi:drug/metabolite transporter (DMT)-like permease
MSIIAIVVLMTASALFTAAALVQVLGHANKRIPYIGPMEPKASLWLFLGGLLAVAAGSFLYSQSQGGDSTLEFAAFLGTAVVPPVIIRLVHNRKVARKQARV